MKFSIHTRLFAAALVAVPMAQSQDFKPGMVVTTCSGGQSTEKVIAIEDLRSPATTGGVKGQLWNSGNTKMPPMIEKSDWNRKTLGQVFGLALGQGDSPDIFTSTTKIYPIDAYSPKGDHIIWRLQSNGGLASGNHEVFYKFNDKQSAGGLGQLAYDKRNSTLYVSNLTDGVITALRDTGTSSAAVVVDKHDHGLSLPSAVPSSPTIIHSTRPDTGMKAAMTALGRLVFAVQVNTDERRLYYAVQDSYAIASSNIPAKNSVWSVGLANDGSITSTDIRREFSLVGQPQGSSTNPDDTVFITDIAFRFGGNEMAIAERGWNTGNPHGATVTHYSRPNQSTAWSKVGVHPIGGGSVGPGRNSAGGVDFSYEYLADQSNIDTALPDSRVLVTGHNVTQIPHPIASSSGVYGIQSTGYADKLNLPFDPTEHYQTDFNGILGYGDKREIGDVEAYRLPNESAAGNSLRCLTVEGKAMCPATSDGNNGNQLISIQVTHDQLGSATNNSPITSLQITDINGQPITPTTPFTMPLQWGQSTSATFQLTPEPGQTEMCVWLNSDSSSEKLNNEFCCKEKVCFNVASCPSCLVSKGIKFDEKEGVKTHIYGRMCSSTIAIENLMLIANSQVLTPVVFTPAAGGCVNFSAPLAAAGTAPYTIMFKASTAHDKEGVASCCETTLEVTEKDSAVPGPKRATISAHH